MKITLKALRYFATAVECGSITKAAEQLHVVPSAVLSAINQVEASFALKLTTRHRSKGIKLTATGRILNKKIHHLIDEYETLLQEGADLKNKLTGTLRIGYYAPIAPAFIPAIARSLLDGNPGVEIKFFECDNQTAQAGLVSGEYDVILCVAESLKPQVSYEILTEVPAYLLVSKDHSLSRQVTVGIADLGSIDLILLDLPVVSEYYSQLFLKANITPRVICSASTVEIIRSLVGAGLGASVLHMRPFTDKSYAGDRLVCIPIHPQPKPFKIVLGYLPESPRRLVSAFVEQTRSYFSSEQAMSMLVKPMN